MLLVAAMAVVLFATRCWGEPSVASPPSAPQSPYASGTTRDAEEWVASVAENGVGHIGSQTEGSERVELSTYVTLGPLSETGREALVAQLRSEIEELESTLDAHLADAAEDAATSLANYQRELEMIARLELLRARVDLVQAGVYLTIPLSGNTPDSVPKEPDGVVSAIYGAYRTEAGELAQVIVWVTRDKRQVMREIHASLRDVQAARREEWIARFNGQPEGVRRDWFRRYEHLAEGVRGGVATMSNQELAEWMALRQVVSQLSLHLDEATLTVR
ncbi:MAG: hypothetical protein KAI24_18555 [Planctomycetes bacterium]|nr:hypothetical protein [Planctomycetota bacterium]